MASHEQATRSGRIVRWAAAIVVILVVATTGFAVSRLVAPGSDEIDHVDAIIVLGPAVPDRIELAAQLMNEHRADELLISVSGDGSDFDAAGAGVCGYPKVTCFTPDPFTTRGEALEAQTLATAEGWSSLGVITGTSHVERSRFIFSTCTELRVRVVESPEGHSIGGWFYQFVYQTAGFAKALVVGCA